MFLEINYQPEMLIRILICTLIRLVIPPLPFKYLYALEVIVLHKKAFAALCRNLEGSLLFLMRPGKFLLFPFSVSLKELSLYFHYWSPCSFFLFFSMFPKSTHETFAQKLYQTFKSHKRFIKPKLSRTDFTIAHYAGEVTWIWLWFLVQPCDFQV